MAPYVGVSLYTWTSIIGVVLAGISIGAYLGGMLADRFQPPKPWLAPLFSDLPPCPFPLDRGGGALAPGDHPHAADPGDNGVIFFVPSCSWG